MSFLGISKGSLIYVCSLEASAGIVLSIMLGSLTLMLLLMLLFDIVCSTFYCAFKWLSPPWS